MHAFKDLLERSIWTFIEAYLGWWLVMEQAEWLRFLAWDNVRAGLVVGGMSVAKVLLAFAQSRLANKPTDGAFPNL